MLTFLEYKVLIHYYTTGIMDTDSNANSDAQQQQNVSRSPQSLAGLETDMNDVQIGQTISSPGRGKFSLFNLFFVTFSAVKKKGKRKMEEGKLIPGSGKEIDFFSLKIF